MRFVVLDFETFFSDDYTLSKQTTESYIRDPRFQAHGAAIKWGKDFPAKWYDERFLREVLRNEDWSDTCIVAHHAHFDGLILTRHYGVHPALWGCTLSMARLLIGNHLSVSLESVRRHFNMPAKLTPYHLFKGKHWEDLSEQDHTQIAEGCCDEAESIWTIFGLLARQFPQEEYAVVDATIRMFTHPVLLADARLLGEIWQAEARAKAQRAAALGIDPALLQSAEQFKKLLEAEGVEIQYKNGKNHQIPCFAKNDEFMQQLLEDEDERIKALAEARLAAKSTLLQTRAETLGFMASRGPLCVYLRMYGAHTTRWSGGDKTNFQNLKKPDPDFLAQEKVNLREAILAPPGWELVKPDSAQIECRLLNWMAGQSDVLDRFRNGEDPYVNVASHFYGYPVNRKEHPVERQVGKVLELQAGYGSGAAKIAHTLRTKARIVLTPEEALRARDAYRDTHPAVVDMWKQGNRMISRLAGGPPLDWGPCHIKDGRLYLPNGCPLIYETLEYHRDEDTGDEFWRVKTRHGWSKLYGAKLVENVIQALARVVISRALIRIARLGYRIVNMEHDSLWILIPAEDGQRDQHVHNVRQEMIRVPEWAPDLPLDCELS